MEWVWWEERWYVMGDLEYFDCRFQKFGKGSRLKDEKDDQ